MSNISDYKLKHYTDSLEEVLIYHVTAQLKSFLHISQLGRKLLEVLFCNRKIIHTGVVLYVAQGKASCCYVAF